MADIKLEVKYRLDLNRDEWNVVSRALRMYAAHGQLGTAMATDLPPQHEREIATELQEQMMRQKHAVLEQMAHESAKHVSNIDKKGR